MLWTITEFVLEGTIWSLKKVGYGIYYITFRPEDPEAKRQKIQEELLKEMIELRRENKQKHSEDQEVNKEELLKEIIELRNENKQLLTRLDNLNK